MNHITVDGQKKKSKTKNPLTGSPSSRLKLIGGWHWINITSLNCFIFFSFFFKKKIVTKKQKINEHQQSTSTPPKNPSWINLCPSYYIFHQLFGISLSWEDIAQNVNPI